MFFYFLEEYFGRNKMQSRNATSWKVIQKSLSNIKPTSEEDTVGWLLRAVGIKDES